ncbi:hypothetical protein [Methanobacterium sp. ACI-7]|uniref:hypothetical protein n=1 Tax=unclassified Methanobacterium TaxID=2627676 RepID=UPI0039C14E98
MLKMERTCNSLRCDVLLENKLIGHMEGVNLTQWFIKNKYIFKGSFAKFITTDPEDCRPGITVDIIFPDKNLIARSARVEWIRAPGKYGTFRAAKMEYYEI